MKKILFVFCFSLLSLLGISQAITQRGTPSVTVSDARLQAQYNLFLPRYTDTTAANSQKGIDSCGALIYTYSNNKLWKRACSPKRWIEVGAATSTPNLQQVTDEGNSTTQEIIASAFNVGQFLSDDNSTRVDQFGVISADLINDKGIGFTSDRFTLGNLSGSSHNIFGIFPMSTYDSLMLPVNDLVKDTMATLRDVRNSGGGGSGTVTSVATGYGLSGGTITTSGTLVADTSVSGLSGKYVRISDTSSLPNYWSRSGNYTYAKASTDSVGIGTSSPAYKLDVNGTINGDAINLQNGVKTGIYGSPNALNFWAGGNKLSTYTIVGNVPGSYFTHDLPFINSASSSGTQNAWEISSSVTPNGANSMIHNQILIDPVYNQSTFGTGAIRGIYYNPTVTSLNSSAHFAWESTSGGIKFGGMSSTSDTTTYKPVGIDNSGNLTKINSWGSVDTTSLSNRIDTKLNISDTSVFQRKSIASYSIVANNTNTTANASPITFRDTSGVYTGTINWTGTAPSGATNHYYQWQQIGKMVKLQIVLSYATAGTAVSNVTMALPSDCPSPSLPAFNAGASSILYQGFGLVALNTTSTTAFASGGAGLRRNAANNDNELFISFASTNPRVARLEVTYRAQ
jgi:hypothetical protein